MHKADPVEVVRQDQIAEHRRRTLTVNRPAPVTGKLQGGGKKPFVAKGHDAILERHQKEGSMVAIVLVSGDTIRGSIKARDKFTVTVISESSQRPVTIFKHAIELFQGVEVAAKEG